MPKPNKVELLSITYRVGDKIFAKSVTPLPAKQSITGKKAVAPPKKGAALPKSPTAGKKAVTGKSLSLMAKAAAPAVMAHPEAEVDNGCGPGCRCVNGFLEILICFGGDCQWQPTDTPCNC